MNLKFYLWLQAWYQGLVQSELPPEVRDVQKVYKTGNTKESVLEIHIYL